MDKTDKLIDLSHPIYCGMPSYPGDPEVSLEKVREIGNDRVNVTKITLGSHSGTHLDVPSHMIQNGDSLDKIDLSCFFGKTIKINFSNLYKYSEDGLYKCIQDNSNYLNNVLTPFQYDGVILETGWWLNFNNPALYFSNQRPVIPISFVKSLLDIKIKFFGCDLPSVDQSGVKDKVIHNLFLQNNIIIYENLTNLDKLPELTPFTFIGFPLSIYGIDGSPVRAVAIRHDNFQ
ncbi:MAG: cyclase family protein [Desulfamplus sp.]|nr:cyclase family protein [Desulfamplus sp.]